MDVNGTRYHLLMGKEDWPACLNRSCDADPAEEFLSPLDMPVHGLVYNEIDNELKLKPLVFQFSTSPYDDKLNLERRRGAGRDRYGNWYWIADSGSEVRVQSAGSGTSSHFWSAEDSAPREPAQRLGGFGPLVPMKAQQPFQFGGLAVTEDHYLVVGMVDPKGLLVFDLHTVGAPRQLVWPEAVDFSPFDMAPRPGGGVWILDRAHKLYWGLDRKMNVVRQDQAVETTKTFDFQPSDQSEVRQSAARPFPEALSLQAASPLDAFDPIAIEALPDGSVLILDHTPSAFSRLLRFRWAELLGAASLDVLIDENVGVVDAGSGEGFGLSGYDMAFVPAHNAPTPALLGQVYVSGFDGNQVYALNVLDDEHGFHLLGLPKYYPMRLFGGKAVVAAGAAVYYDYGESWLLLIEQKRPRYESEASFCTFVLDGKQPGCVWHRLLLDACIPADADVQIWSRTADELQDVRRARWWAEPRLLRRPDGSELPFVPRPDAADAGTWELLFQRAAGRFLQLKITLRGNGRSTPRLRALRVYYPRFSYLEHYLPAVYREDQASASFLERFLANMEGTLTSLEDKIANVQMLFDVNSAPAETLEWLADWLGVVLDPVWDERRRRLFIQYAMEFFQYRGTIRGLLIALHMALDSCVDQTVFTQPLSFGRIAARDQGKRKLSGFRIVENFRTRQTPAVVLGDPSDTQGLRVVVTSQRWTPAQGRDSLSQRWQAEAKTGGDFPLQAPAGALAPVWQSFARTALGFIPRANSSDLARWQDFLAGRYGAISALNAAYGLSGSSQYSSFSLVPLPAALPADGSRLLDWYEFEGIILPMGDSAHRFTVMLPAPVQLTAAQRQERLDIAQRVIDLEKPAHTTFRLKFYWAMFRVGEARLGEDTLIDLGSRAPDLMPPFVLGRNYLSEGYLAPGHPQNVDDRLVLNRDRLSDDPNRNQHI